MTTALLVIIYVAFISLGLPDSLLGSGWPVMRLDFGVSTDMGGIVSFVVSAGTVISSIMSARLIEKFGAGKITAVSVAFTAGALLGFSFSGAYWLLIAAAVPMGLGAGAVDAALNNFVALHFAAKHMSWLHCFWGIGAMMSPMIMSFFIGNNNNWRGGYRTIGIFQCVLVVILFLSLPIWKKFESKKEAAEKIGSVKHITIREVIAMPAAKWTFISFFCYCAVEVSTNMWNTSYFVEYKGLEPGSAAVISSMFFGGITVGRLISGFVSTKINSAKMIRYGCMILSAGIIIVLLPLPWYISAAGILLTGLGCAPIYPSIIHLTPERFGENASQSVVGLEMASAYVGSTLMPPITGFICERIGFSFFPVILIVLAAVMFICTEIAGKKAAAQAA